MSSITNNSSLMEYDDPLLFNLIVEEYHKKRSDYSIIATEPVNLTKYEIRYQDCPYKISKGDPILIIGSQLENVFTISADTHFVLYPRQHISITSVASTASNQCLRMSYLKDRLPGMFSITLPLIIGSLGHFLFEFLLSQNLTVSQLACEQNLSQSSSTIIEILREASMQYLQSEDVIQQLYTANITMDRVIEEAEKFFPSIISWAKKLTTSKLDPSTCFILHNTLVRFEILATEEYIEDNIYGLKGIYF